MSNILIPWLYISAKRGKIQEILCFKIPQRLRQYKIPIELAILMVGTFVIILVISFMAIDHALLSCFETLTSTFQSLQGNNLSFLMDHP